MENLNLIWPYFMAVVGIFIPVVAYVVIKHELGSKISWLILLFGLILTVPFYYIFPVFPNLVKMIAGLSIFGIIAGIVVSRIKLKFYFILPILFALMIFIKSCFIPKYSEIYTSWITQLFHWVVNLF